MSNFIKKFLLIILQKLIKEKEKIIKSTIRENLINQKKKEKIKTKIRKQAKKRKIKIRKQTKKKKINMGIR